MKAVSSEMFIRNFQFKILRNTVFTNSRPIKIGFQMIFVPFVEVSICHSNERLPRFLHYRIEWNYHLKSKKKKNFSSTDYIETSRGRSNPITSTNSGDSRFLFLSMTVHLYTLSGEPDNYKWSHLGDSISIVLKSLKKGRLYRNPGQPTLLLSALSAVIHSIDIYVR